MDGIRRSGNVKIEWDSKYAFPCGELQALLNDGARDMGYKEFFIVTALPTPAVEKEEKKCEHEWNFFGTGGSKTSINNDYVCQKCGLVKKEVTPIHQFTKLCQSPKPEAGLPLPEKLEQIDVFHLSNFLRMEAMQIKFNEIIKSQNIIIDYLSQDRKVR